MPPKRSKEVVYSEIVLLHREGKETKHIVQKVGVSERTVRRVVAKFKAGGSSETPQAGTSSGRPRVLSPRAQRVVRRSVEGNPTLTAKEIKIQNWKVLKRASVRTVSRELHDRLGYKRVTAKRKPLLNKRQKKNRLDFAKKYKDWGLDQWRKVLWTDESTFYVGERPGKKVYSRRDSDPLDPRRVASTFKHPPYLMVWAGFAFGGKSELVVLPRNTSVTKEVYYTLLNEHLEGAFEASSASFFQQDGAPAHTSRLVRGWLEDCCIEYFKQWPSQSPDLNSIENL